jgi:hypothetical protein
VKAGGEAVPASPAWPWAQDQAYGDSGSAGRKDSCVSTSKWP